MIYHYKINVTYTENSHLQYTIPIRTTKRNPEEAISVANEEECFLRKEDYKLVSEIKEITYEEYMHLLKPGTRKILIADGMSHSKTLVLTDAPEMEINKWCLKAVQDLLPNEENSLDSLQEDGYYVRILVDTEAGPGYLEDIDVIGYDEVYDLCDFYDLD